MGAGRHPGILFSYMHPQDNIYTYIPEKSLSMLIGTSMVCSTSSIAATPNKLIMPYQLWACYN